ncbi:MAG: hypothetical protein QOI63_427 [Thermoplasmata archaeon]|jgi:MYXO-CTERM domain-containing protein|nr:hypothetical protein [Thermoplasmata archaeon]
MRSTLLPACLTILLLAPLASAGSAGRPEISDTKGDAGLDVLDILSVWVDAGDSQNLTLHVTLAAAPPKPPATPATPAPSTDACPVETCVFSSLSYVFSFRVLGPDGLPTPLFPDYERTFVAYRAGAKAANVATPMGYTDARGALVIDGTAANATVSGTELVLRLPRTSVFVNLPVGPTPGPYIVSELSGYSQPEFCFPQQSPPTQHAISCAPFSKPQQTTGTPPAGLADHWDVAPDSGFGRVFTYPSPPPPAPPAPTTTTTPPPPAPTLQPTPTPGPTPTPQPQPQPQPAGTAQPAPAAPAASTSTSHTSTSQPPAKTSPAPELAGVLAVLAGLLAVRRRLSA